MLIRSKAPLRLGLAGGGTDVSPYSDQFGGAILNATIDMYAYATIKPLSGTKIRIRAMDRGEEITCKAEKKLSIDGRLDLAKGVYNRVVKDFINKPVAFELTPFVDAPAGSGLGTSTKVVTSKATGFFIKSFTTRLYTPLARSRRPSIESFF